jgi:UDP-glucose 4-epimerase
LVLTALEQIDTIQGKVLSRYMKAAQIEDLLETWTQDKGGSWERMEGRPGEREDEFLIGDIELPYAREIEYDGVKHYIISFNEKSEKPLDFGLSSANTERLSREEMLNLINSPRD